MSTSIWLSLVKIGLKTKNFYHYAKFWQDPFLNCVNSNYYSCNLCFQLVIGCQNARKKSPERRILRLSGEEESGHFSGEDELEDSRTHHNNNARGQLMQEKAGNSNSRVGTSSGHSSGHMSHRNEITSGIYLPAQCGLKSEKSAN